MGDLEGWGDIIRKSGEKRRAEAEKLNEALGEPDLFVPFEDSAPDGGIGYWRVEGGLISYVRHKADGAWDVHSRHEYETDLIEKLHGLLERKPRQFEWEDSDDVDAEEGEDEDADAEEDEDED